MSERIQAVRGMNDILPDQTPLWQALEHKIQTCLQQYGYREIRFPLVESTHLFKRSIGEVTDIVEKEMYTFTDMNGDSLTLRPEGTAGCVRACLEHGLLHNQQQRLWYMGPMFRHEKPQKGRYRQFFQMGVEAFGFTGVEVELEIIAMTWRLWQVLGIDKSIQLQINTLGELAERQAYKDRLVAWLKEHFSALDEDSKKRLERNPLRILDSKNPDMQALLVDAPKLEESLSVESKAHFNDLQKGLDALGIAYTINPLLVRGLDYYGQTVIEWVTDKLGSQATVCAGGRYDALVEQLGGVSVPAFGIALGLERLLLLMEILGLHDTELQPPSLFIMAGNPESFHYARNFAEILRDQCAGWTVLLNISGGSFKNQFKKADKSGAQFALIFGEDEIRNNQIGVKNLRDNVPQVNMAPEECIDFIKNHRKV